MSNYILAAEKFLNTIRVTKNLSKKTVVAYESDLRDFMSFIDQQIINERTLICYVQSLQATRNLKESTIKRKLVVLKMFFDYIYKQGLIEQNYYQQHNFCFNKEKKLPKTLSFNDISNLLNTAIMIVNEAQTPYSIWKSTRDLALIDLLISTGIRIAEASEISISDIVTSEQIILTW